jgi:hypothetical protein
MRSIFLLYCKNSGLLILLFGIYDITHPNPFCFCKMNTNEYSFSYAESESGIKFANT